VTLEELAREFGMTKNTLNYRIKNAVRKILRKYLSS
jgi:predicted DNA binding protein